MKKKYFKPSMEVFTVNDEDIIATSYGNVPGGGTGSSSSKGGYYGDYDDEDF